MAQRRNFAFRRGHSCEISEMDETFTQEAHQITQKHLRFMVLGSDDLSLRQACRNILQNRQGGDTSGACVPTEGHVSGRQVSVVRTPSYWLEHLKSYLFFSRGVKSMKNEMEFCESLLFPGPHAFLLVLRDVSNSGKQHYLLEALSEVFGKEALDYSMVIFRHEHTEREINQNLCVRECRHRYHILKDTEGSVLELFEQTEAMLQHRKNKYFIHRSELLQIVQKYFDREFDPERDGFRKMKETMEKQSEEFTELKSRESKLSKELNASKGRESKLTEELNASKVKESKLSEELNASKGRESKLSKELTASKDRESKLSEELNQCRS